MNRRRSVLVALPFAALAIELAGCDRPGSAPPTPAARPAPGASAPAASGRSARASSERWRLAGWWLCDNRRDMLVIDFVGEDGRLAARFMNPDPVWVRKAEAWKEAGSVRLVLELVEAEDSGNFYELAYDPARDLLAGVYHRLDPPLDTPVSFSRYAGGQS